jgi:hypothetical protein
MSRCRPFIGRVLRDTRTASTGKGARMQAQCPQGVLFRTQHPLGVVVNRPSVWLTDDFRAVLVCTPNTDSGG